MAYLPDDQPTKGIRGKIKLEMLQRGVNCPIGEISVERSSCKIRKKRRQKQLPDKQLNWERENAVHKGGGRGSRDQGV